MKKLNLFTYFDFEEFAKGKRFMSIGQQEWKDFKTGNVLGTKLVVVIIQDKTVYTGVPDGEVVSNIYEKLIIKIPVKISVSMNVEVRLINAVATVFGEFRNQLSVTAENIEVVGK